MSARTDPCGGYQATDIPTATRELKQRGIGVRLGMEATGYARWFERLLAELGFELWIGDPAVIKTKRVRKKKTDRQDARLLLR
jgi:transposase